MKTTRVFAWACALAVAGVVSAQEPWSGHELQPPEGAAVAVAPVSGEWVAKDRVVDLPNPVPTRIETSYYGERLFPNALQIECSIYGEEPCIPGRLGCLVAAAQVSLSPFLSTPSPGGRPRLRSPPTLRRHRPPGPCQRGCRCASR